MKIDIQIIQVWLSRLMNIRVNGEDVFLLGQTMQEFREIINKAYSQPQQEGGETNGESYNT